MTDSTTFFSNHVAGHMEAIAHAASSAAESMTAAAELITQSLLAEGQILACGNGKTNGLAQYFCSSLLNRYESDRPALPALNIGADATTFAAICKDNKFNETFSRQVRAFGRDTDTLLVLTDEGNKSSIVQAIQAAHDRGMRVIAITGREEADIHSLMHPEDVTIGLPELAPGNAAEVMLVLLNALCGMIETSLFGHMEQD